MLYCYVNTFLYCYLATLLPCYPATLLPCHLVTVLPWYPGQDVISDSGFSRCLYLGSRYNTRLLSCHCMYVDTSYHLASSKSLLSARCQSKYKFCTKLPGKLRKVIRAQTFYPAVLANLCSTLSCHENTHSMWLQPQLLSLLPRIASIWLVKDKRTAIII